MHLNIVTPKDYEFVATVPPAPEGVSAAEWQPQWVRFLLTYKGKELLRGTLSIQQLDTVHAEVNRAISNHQIERRYNRSLAGLWNSYPVDWIWRGLQLLGFRYYAGGRSATHSIHYFVRNLRSHGVMIRFKGKMAGASFPRLYVTRTWAEMFNGIEEGRYE